MTRRYVAIVLYYPGSLKFHPSIVNSARLLAESGFEVDIFKPVNPDDGDLVPPGVQIVHACEYERNPVRRMASLLEFRHAFITRCRSYEATLAVDAYGLLLSSLVPAKSAGSILYFSLELLSPSMNDCVVRLRPWASRFAYYAHSRLLKHIERRLHRRVAMTIIQDETRWSVLRCLNGIDERARVLFLPNSPCEDRDPSTPSRYLREKFHIPDSQKIVLYAGSLGTWTGIDRLVEEACNWPMKFVLVLHGRGLPGFVEKLSRRVMESAGRIVLSLDQLNENEYESMVRSADIGISWYADRADPNVYYIGAGSGKLFYYMKHGLPVIANRFPGLPEIIDGCGAGLCVESEADIQDALVRLEARAPEYAVNARRCFRMYEFSRRFSPVSEAIAALAPQR